MITKVQQAFRFALDPEPRQIRMLQSHAGAARFAFNWGLSTFAESLDAYQAEKEAGVAKPTTKLPDHFALCKRWTIHKDDPENGLDWVGSNFSGTYQAALRDAHAAWKNFLDSKGGRRAGRKVGRPRFKSRRRSAPAFQMHGDTLRVDDYRHLVLPKIGRVRSHEKTKKLLRLINRPKVTCTDCSGLARTLQPATGKKKLPSGTARTLTQLMLTGTLPPAALVLAAPLQQALVGGKQISECKPCKGTGLIAHTRLVRGNITRSPSGRWFISLTVETHRDVRAKLVDGQQVPKPSKRQRAGGTVGIDWGVRDLATLSTGEVLGNPRHLKAALGKLRRAQQDLSRKAEGSKGRAKARHRVAQLHGRIADLREDYLEKATSKLVHEHAHLVVEGWDVAQTMAKAGDDVPKRVRRNRNLAMADTGIGMARWMIEHKAAWYGAAVTITGTHEPTGRTCSRCGQVRIKPVLPAEETFNCPSCGYSGSRRVNTARALVRLAHHDAPGSGESQNARGGDVRPEAPRRGGRSPSKRVARARPPGRGQTSTPDP